MSLRLEHSKRLPGKVFERDQVDFAGDAAQQFDQLPRVFQCVVHAAQHDVFPGDAAVLAVVLYVLMAGIQQGGEAVTRVHRHDFVAQFVVRRVQGDGEA